MISTSVLNAFKAINLAFADASFLRAVMAAFSSASAASSAAFAFISRSFKTSIFDTVTPPPNASSSASESSGSSIRAFTAFANFTAPTAAPHFFRACFARSAALLAPAALNADTAESFSFTDVPMPEGVSSSVSSSESESSSEILPSSICFTSRSASSTSAWNAPMDCTVRLRVAHPLGPVLSSCVPPLHSVISSSSSSESSLSVSSPGIIAFSDDATRFAPTTPHRDIFVCSRFAVSTCALMLATVDSFAAALHCFCIMASADALPLLVDFSLNFAAARAAPTATCQRSCAAAAPLASSCASSASCSASSASACSAPTTIDSDITRLAASLNPPDVGCVCALALPAFSKARIAFSFPCAASSFSRALCLLSEIASAATFSASAAAICFSSLAFA
mmetsp:Transcript_61441/g.101575  ORF Transcript_61441/g.101575 Transcript_61441/m.101575 type:complete len:395 (-) Transcript_61441:1475-2659(-)